MLLQMLLGRAIQFCESQLKAWAEYRYKAKLIQVGASDLGHFGKVESRIGCRNVQKRTIEGNLAPRMLLKNVKKI